MWINQIFSLINENEIQNIIVCDNYEVANQIARASYGETAYAVDTTLYPVGIGYKHIDGFFYDTSDNLVEANPTEAEEIANLKNLNTSLMLAIADLDLQRETDKLETQLAVADLAEAILGGVE